MKLNPKKIYYVISKDETTIVYDEIVRNKAEEKMFVFKGKFQGQTTVFNIVNFLEQQKDLNTQKVTTTQLQNKSSI